MPEKSPSKDAPLPIEEDDEEDEDEEPDCE
jgi:hypothetical protein